MNELGAADGTGRPRIGSFPTRRRRGAGSPGTRRRDDTERLYMSSPRAPVRPCGHQIRARRKRLIRDETRCRWRVALRCTLQERTGVSQSWPCGMAVHTDTACTRALLHNTASHTLHSAAVPGSYLPSYSHVNRFGPYHGGKHTAQSPRHPEANTDPASSPGIPP